MQLSKIRFDESPNCYPPSFKNTHEYIVIHAMVGTFAGSESWLKNPHSCASAHYLVSQLGEVVEMVHVDRQAWHCYGMNAKSIGIELEDKGLCEKNGTWVTPVLWSTAVDLAASLCKVHNIPITKIIAHSDPMVAQIAKNAHHPEMIHRDPGPYFAMDKFKSDVAAKLRTL